jgi:hypothetical protein
MKDNIITPSIYPVLTNGFGFQKLLENVPRRKPNFNIDDYKKMDIPNADKLASSFIVNLLRSSKRIVPSNENIEEWLKVHS